MSQSRITLTAEVQALADDLCRFTGCSNLASLLGLMLTRYGGHLRQTWRIVDFELPKRLEQSVTPIIHLQENHNPCIEDPAITRIAKLIEDF